MHNNKVTRHLKIMACYIHIFHKTTKTKTSLHYNNNNHLTWAGLWQLTPQQSQVILNTKTEAMTIKKRSVILSEYIISNVENMSLKLNSVKGLRSDPLNNNQPIYIYTHTYIKFLLIKFQQFITEVKDRFPLHTWWKHLWTEDDHLI